jgi:CRP/FNR family transcriptional regulator
VIKEEEAQRVASALRRVARLDADLALELMQRSALAQFPSGQDLMAVGDRVEAVPLIISGSVRVFQIGESGREITLYRFGAGECCVLSADSILGNRMFPAHARVEDDVELAMIPAPLFNDLLARSSTWRSLVFGAMSQRLLSLMNTLEDVAFERMDARVGALLVKRARQRPGAVLRLTHQQIADDLGTAREVVSRVLEDFRGRGLIRLARGEVEVIDPAGLTGLSTP